MSEVQEIWKVECPDGVFDADFATLAQWISEGIVHPVDRVSKGKLRWIEAGKVPALRRLFDGDFDLEQLMPSTPDELEPVEEQVEELVSNRVDEPADERVEELVEEPVKSHAINLPEPVELESSLAYAAVATPAVRHLLDSHAPQRVQTIAGFDLSSLTSPAPEMTRQKKTLSPDGTPCHFHQDVPAAHACRLCFEVFCPACVKVVGTSKVTRYRLHWAAEEPIAPAVARVVATRAGQGGRPGQPIPPGRRKMVIDFAGPTLTGLTRQSGVQPTVTLNVGQPIDPVAYPVEGADRWRLMFDYEAPPSTTLDLRALLTQGGKPLTETWIYQVITG